MSSLIEVERPQTAAAESQQYQKFALIEQTFAVSVERVREIIEYANLTTVPMAPDYVKGVLNLRGSVVPVIDLAVRFGRGESSIHRRSCIVIVEVERKGVQQELGVVVDAVSEVLEIPASEIEPPPTFGARIRTDFIAGMGKLNDGFVILLNVDRILADDELSQLAELSDREQADA